jgi:hypothetical protein
VANAADLRKKGGPTEANCSAGATADGQKRRALGHAMNEVLQQLGVAVCGTEFGKQLGGGLFEFRLRRDLREGASSGGGKIERILLRVFCHAQGDRVILLVGGYDKGEHPSPRRQNAEIELARARLREWQRRQARRGRG